MTIALCKLPENSPGQDDKRPGLKQSNTHFATCNDIHRAETKSESTTDFNIENMREMWLKFKEEIYGMPAVWSGGLVCP